VETYTCSYHNSFAEQNKDVSRPLEFPRESSLSTMASSGDLSLDKFVRFRDGILPGCYGQQEIDLDSVPEQKISVADWIFIDRDICGISLHEYDPDSEYDLESVGGGFVSSPYGYIFCEQLDDVVSQNFQQQMAAERAERQMAAERQQLRPHQAPPSLSPGFPLAKLPPSAQPSHPLLPLDENNEPRWFAPSVPLPDSASCQKIPSESCNHDGLLNSCLREIPPRGPSVSQPVPAIITKHDHDWDFGTPQNQASPLAASCAEQSDDFLFFGELLPGDVLSIVDDDSTLARLGNAGGYVGHVVLVVSEPLPVQRQSEVGHAFRNFWSVGENALYSVGTVECCRNTEGLTEADLIFSVDKAGRVQMCGDCPCNGTEICLLEDAKEMHIWRSPSNLRGENFHTDVMCEVLQDMRANQQNWSWSTAVRAVLFSGEISSLSSNSITMEEIEGDWEAEPICTSVVVVFWQRYLQKLAASEATDALQLILQFMPVRADRVLPGELRNLMFSRGWSLSRGYLNLLHL